MSDESVSTVADMQARFRPLSPAQSALFEANPNPVLALDGLFRIRYVNPAASEYGSVDPDSLLGAHVWTRYPHLRGSIFELAYDAVLRDGIATSFEDREPTLHRWRAVYAYPADGGVIAILEDITERRRAELALKASEEALARAQSLASIGNFAFSPDSGLSLSAEAFRLLGLDPVVSHADLPAIRARLPKDQLDALSRALTQAVLGDDVRATVQFLRFDGRHVEIDVLMRVSERIRDAVTQAYGTIQDVTERVRANEALRRSEESLRLASEAANIGIFDRDLRTSRTYWSEQLLRILGLDPRTVDQRWIDTDPSFDFIHSEDRDAVRETFVRALETAQKQVTRHRIVRGDGTIRHLLGSIMLVLDERGAPARVVGTAMDVTDDVEAEGRRLQLESQLQQAQKLESLGVLAGGIAHDFNNLLVGMLGNASLALLDLDTTHHVRETLAEIEGAAQRAADLTRQLLAYAGKGRYVIDAVDVSPAVHEMSALLRTAASGHASMHMELPEGLPTIDADPTQFRQIVMNLITNASEALDDRAGVISLRTGFRDVGAAELSACIHGANLEPGRFVFIEVSDTGVGMDADTISRIFDPFFSTKFTGRGLGLAATLGIVRSHRGAIRVISVPGAGSTFTLLFPPGERRPSPVNAPIAAAWRSTAHVLVVDDEPSVRAVTTALLSRRGMTVSGAENGEVALTLFRADPLRYDLVLLDLTMPILDGAAAFEALRAIRSDALVLLMSGYNEQEVTQRFVGRGLTGFLQKPFTANELYDKLAQTLGIGR